MIKKIIIASFFSLSIINLANCAAEFAAAAKAAHMLKRELSGVLDVKNIKEVKDQISKLGCVSSILGIALRKTQTRPLIYDWSGTTDFSTKIGFSLKNKSGKPATVVVQNDSLPNTMIRRTGFGSYDIKGKAAIAQVPANAFYNLELDISKPTYVSIRYDCPNACKVKNFTFAPGKTIYVSWGIPEARSTRASVKAYNTVEGSTEPYLYPQTGIHRGLWDVTDLCLAKQTNKSIELVDIQKPPVTNDLLLVKATKNEFDDRFTLTN